MSVEDKIRLKLQTHLNIELLEVVNESPYHQVPEGSESHFRVLIVSKDFEGLSTVKRHQKVYRILGEELRGPVHAFSQKTFTPKEWKGMAPSVSPSPPCRKKG
jgi:BolA protein